MTRVLDPWVRGEEFEFGERRWNPSRCDLQVVEGAKLRPDELSIGRGWHNAVRSGTDVTERLLALRAGVPEGATGIPAGPQVLEAAILEAAVDRPITFGEVARMAASEQLVGLRASERLAVCEQTVWRLLHQHRLRILTEEAAVNPTHWASLIADWETWTRNPAQVWLVSAETES